MRLSSRFRWVVAVLSVVGCLSAAGAEPQDKPAAPIKSGSAQKRPAANAESRLADRLVEVVDFPGIEANTPLKDALTHLNETYHLRVEVDRAAFNMNEVDNTPVRLPKMKGVRLGHVVEKLAAELGGVYLVRADHIELTTPTKRAVEVWGTLEQSYAKGAGGFLGGLGGGGFGGGALGGALGGMGITGMGGGGAATVMTRRRPVLPLVQTALDEVPLAEALKKMSQATGVSVIVDASRLKDSAKMPVSAVFKNTPLDTAVRILANMAGAKVVLLDNVLLVTTPANAKALQAEQEEANQQGLEELPALEKGPVEGR